MAAGSGWIILAPFGRGLSPGNHTRFPVSPHRTVHEVFPHTALLQEIRVAKTAYCSPYPLVSSEDPESYYRRLIALAIRLSSPSSENTCSRSPSLDQSYVVSDVNSTMTPSDSLPDSSGLRTRPYTGSLLPDIYLQGPDRVSPVDKSSLPACRP